MLAPRIVPKTSSRSNLRRKIEPNNNSNTRRPKQSTIAAGEYDLGSRPSTLGNQTSSVLNQDTTQGAASGVHAVNILNVEVVFEDDYQRAPNQPHDLFSSQHS